ncbi:WD repeat-containing protein pop1 [Byssothecium circinans]|uniref:WD repeat-containing protein pop1 n=1 Tax=Byssothecium circinans TaxID=147558 RepID=A0A6A5TDV8_9PLEO|nr:WD repeat-containing protein pop1 [Byssothecium circinans]
MMSPGHSAEVSSTSTLPHPQAIDPYATVAHLSIAPATTTTVVTTTTTTTTQFPPMCLKQPRSLRERDPKEYPLAHIPAPESIRKVLLDVGDEQLLFEEANDGAQAIKEHQILHGNLSAANGKVQTVESLKGKPTFATPSRMTRPNTAASQPALRSVSGRRKRSSSPPSIAEAAEIASLHRRSKKPRLSIHDYKHTGAAAAGPNFTPEDMDDPVPTTPDADADTGRSQSLKPSKPVKRVNLRSSSQQARKTQLPPAWQLQNPLAGPSNNEQSLEANRRILSEQQVVSTPMMDGPGIAATPPIADTDLEPVGPFASTDVTYAQRPTPLNTLVAQDASLPSPSLSPVTAAANLAQQTNPLVPFLGDEDEDSHEVSSLDLSQDISTERRASKPFSSPSWPKQIKLPDPDLNHTLNAQLPTPPTIMDIPTMLDAFDQFPQQMKTYFMYQMLRRCPKPTLHFVADVVNPALKCDFIAQLPIELSLNIIGYLDAQSMCNAARVSRIWRQRIDTDEGTWKRLLDTDGFVLPENELERAIEEGWGWQYPQIRESYERDLRTVLPSSRSEGTTPPSSSGLGSLTNADAEGATARLSSGRQKRKANTKHAISKKQRKKGPSKYQTALFARSHASKLGPFQCANFAADALPEPDIGLASLRQMHLYKSLYQRHHSIRKSWMDPETKPKHIAFQAHQHHVVTCLQFDTDKILTGSDDTNINVYDTKTGALRNCLEGHEGGVWALQYEGNTLVSGSTDRSVRVWDIEKGKCTQVFQGHTSTVRCLVILKPTQVGETLDGQPIMMPKEDLIITGSRDSSLRVWKLPKPGERSIMQTGPPANDYDNPYFIRALTGHHHSVRAIAAHGDTLVSGSYDCNVRVWKISTGDVLYRLQGHTQKVYSVVLDTERNRCISGSMDNMVKVWSLETGACIFTLEGHTSLVGLLDLSHERLVSAAADSTLRIWDPENGQCKSRLCAHTGAITCFQHDGQKVISGSDRTLKMWNVKTGEFVKDLLTDLSGVWQVKFNERRCVAAVQRNNMTYIEVLDFGASRDGVPLEQRGKRIVVGSSGNEISDEEELVDTEPV